jgi:hypothetical protein
MSVEASNYVAVMKQTLEKIATVNAMDYEYQRWAREALAIAEAEKHEPFGIFQYDMRIDAWVQNRNSDKGVAFYTHPQPKREWTNEQIDALMPPTALRGKHASNEF